MLVALSMPRRERASQIKAWLERCMIRKTIVIIIMAAFATNIGRCADHVKGKLYFFSDTGIVAQKVKGGVLLWGRDDLAKGKSWKDADFLALLRLKDTSRINKGMSGGGGWFKYIGIYRHGNLFTGHRDVPMFEIPTKEEIAQAEYLQQEEEKQRLAEQTKQRRILAEQRRLEDEQRKIRDRAEQERAERELQRQREENERKLAAERARAEIEAEKQRQEAARQAEEERKRRYPIEQKERAEYAETMLSKISFDVNSYFDIQKDLRRFVHSVSVTEKRWATFKELQSTKDWLGLLNAIAERKMKDFPAQAEIKDAIDNLKGATFHAEFLFTHTDDKRHSGLHHRMCVGEISPGDRYRPIRWDQGNFSRDVVWDLDNASLIVPFSIHSGKNKFIHSQYPDPPGWELQKKRHEQLNKISSDAKLGRITQSEAEERRKIAEDELMKGFSAWLNTSKVRDSHYPVRVRKGMKNVSVGSSSNIQMPGVSNNPSTPQWETCPDCDGSRFISKGKCPKCDGVGRYWTQSTQGIRGQPLRRMAQCDKCKGNGEIKELCKRCYGHGKVKQ